MLLVLFGLIGFTFFYMSQLPGPVAPNTHGSTTIKATLPPPSPPSLHPLPQLRLTAFCVCRVVCRAPQFSPAVAKAEASATSVLNDDPPAPASEPTKSSSSSTQASSAAAKKPVKSSDAGPADDGDDLTTELLEEELRRGRESLKLKEEELRTLREECEKNKATADAGELFKISQEVMKLRGARVPRAVCRVRVARTNFSCGGHRETERSGEREWGAGR